MEFVQFFMANGLEIFGAALLILTGVIAIAEMIPGDQPEKSLQAVVDFLKKFSKK